MAAQYTPKYQLIVKAARGIVVRDRPAPESDGALKMRAEPMGRILMAHAIVNIDGVEYAGLVPQNPLKPEWVRIAERDHSIEYLEVIQLTGGSEDNAIAAALGRLASAVERLADATMLDR